MRKTRRGNNQYSRKNRSDTYRQHTEESRKNIKLSETTDKKTGALETKKTGFFDKLKKLFTKGK